MFEGVECEDGALVIRSAPLIMAITRETVLHVAKLARLELEDSEIDRMQKDLGNILEYVNSLAELDTDAVAETTQVAVLGAPLRPDAVEPQHTWITARMTYVFALAGLRGSEAHDEIGPDRRRTSNRAGGIEAGISNGEEIVVRAAMKPLPTLMKPLGSVDLATGEPAEGSDVSAVEALAVVAEAAVAWELARAACEKFAGDAVGDFVAAWRAYVERIDWTSRSS